jgi:hypothetical protein
MQRLGYILALATLAGSCATDSLAGPTPEGAVPFAPPPIYAVWFSRTEACAQRTGQLDRLEWLMVPGVDTFDTADGPQHAMWRRRGGRHQIILAGNYAHHEMVVRHEMLHALLDRSGHPAEYFEVRCGLTWETWRGETGGAPGR